MLLSEYDQSAVKVADTALDRILKFHIDKESNPPAPATGLLYHYTTADGLKGIIETNQIWATSAYFLNDSTEITYGYGLLKEVLNDWISKNQRSEDSLTLGLARDLRKGFGEDLLERNIVNAIYLACFCEEDNLLTQWRTYGQSGGYSLGFRVPAHIGQALKPEPNTCTSKLVKVEYDRKEQVRRCNAILDLMFSIIDNPATAQAIVTIGDHPLLGYFKFRTAISEILVEEIVGFKNEAFRDEKEWRLVVRPRGLTKQATDNGAKTPTPVHFRSSRGALVPYVRLIPTDPAKKLPIACIRSGPTLDKTTAAIALSMILETNGFPCLPVRGSDIPVRLGLQ